MAIEFDPDDQELQADIIDVIMVLRETILEDPRLKSKSTLALLAGMDVLLNELEEKFDELSNTKLN
jgi:hypothetical protein